MDLSIGQMARINHISIQTLRLYDKMGLLKPVAVDAGSGYRYYSILQCAKLDLIGSLKQCGLSLKEIGSYFENGNIESLEGGPSQYLRPDRYRDETAVRTERGSKTHAGVF